MRELQIQGHTVAGPRDRDGIDTVVDLGGGRGDGVEWYGSLHTGTPIHLPVHAAGRLRLYAAGTFTGHGARRKEGDRHGGDPQEKYYYAAHFHRFRPKPIAY